MASGHEMIVILDFGSQYTQLIARRVREQNVYCEILPFNADLTKLSGRNVKGYILSGGPASVLEDGSPKLSLSFYETSLPVLGICYGLHLMALQLGGKLSRAEFREYGRAMIDISTPNRLLKDVASPSQVWMSHGDSVDALPDGFARLATTSDIPYAAVADDKRRFYGVQFHPEVMHTTEGTKILRNFLFDICGLTGDWTTESFIESSIRQLRETIGQDKIILGISGGVDSTVAATLLHKAIGNQMTAIFVNNGLLRKNEYEEVIASYQTLGINLRAVDASKLFLDGLAGVVDPEHKRKIIGRTFIEVFEEAARSVGDAKYLAQGTLYPDVIESTSFKGPSATIKSHHNVGGLPDKMHLKVVEPLRELFKDEVRTLGRKLGLSESFIGRHPFPGPGLAVRVIGEITDERLRILRDADAIYISELKSSGQYDKIWQAFAVLLPVQSVGVMGDMRTYENVIALRAVTSTDGMTADWARIPDDILARISNRVINEVRGVNRVCYDVSSKPPATIEWE
ncbi:MAG: glutamine-hydrolyzing GMP synthase [candidate division Zixibacteria bacterium]|nr:glutamine-hydrolyzing GMP synthase [candidate division Zixibacteria bacterium]